jgi:hypothetical protein
VTDLATEEALLEHRDRPVEVAFAEIHEAKGMSHNDLAVRRVGLFSDPDRFLCH